MREKDCWCCFSCFSVILRFNIGYSASLSMCILLCLPVFFDRPCDLLCFVLVCVSCLFLPREEALSP